jgi:hypothetical protein
MFLWLCFDTGEPEMNIRNGGQSAAYHDARYRACLQQIAQRDYDALDAYDAAGCFMPEGGLSDEELSIGEFNDWLASLKGA